MARPSPPSRYGRLTAESETLGICEAPVPVADRLDEPSGVSWITRDTESG
ncbi:MAG: hypothetical protein M3R38_02605 [Actinomycetota bacterium]|nr:hypothetical protein [Actinomycetota bacterium]